MEDLFTIGKLAKLTGLSRKSIRYYEEEKLIPTTERSMNGYRLYRPKVIERLRFIQKAREIGFSLGEIRGILELSKRGGLCCDKVFAWSEEKLAKIDEQILLLQKLKKKIKHYRTKWKKNKKLQVVSESEICKLIGSINIEEE